MTINIKNYDDSCKISVDQKNIPSEVDLDFLENGWKDRIFK